MNSLRNLVRPQDKTPPAALPAGERVYAVGDVHGRRDLFDALISRIEKDDAARGPARTTIVLLGDLIDRGPDSAGVISSARALAARRRLRIICGNHEEMFLKSFDDIEVLRAFLRYGGRETVLSYAVDVAEWNGASLSEAQDILRRAVPPEDIAFISAFEDGLRIGDYLFVHAGIMPGVEVDAQKQEDLRWMREPFLSHSGSHGPVVIHGHTISEAPQIRANRIGIDTGAYMHGRLTALGLEGDARWLMTATETEGRMTFGKLEL